MISLHLLDWLISLRAFHSLNVSRASDLWFNLYSSVCLVVPSRKGSIYRPPAMAVSNGPHMSECPSCSVSVAREGVGIKGFRANLHLMQISQSHFPVILRASVIIGKISKALRLMCDKRRFHNIRFSASCRDACPVVLCFSWQQSLSISVYTV